VTGCWGSFGSANVTSDSDLERPGVLFGLVVCPEDVTHKTVARA